MKVWNESGSAKPVQWIVEHLTQAWGDGARWHVDNGNHPHEEHYLKLNCSKAKAHLNWLPKWRLEMTLDKIIGRQKSISKVQI